jgi:hypothetical protein
VNACITLIKTKTMRRRTKGLLRGGILGEPTLKKVLIVLSGLSSLMIMANDGAPANEYRIERSSVKFRTFNPSGQPYAEGGNWRVLNSDEIELHFALRTPVADWLDKNLYISAYPSAQA